MKKLLFLMLLLGCQELKAQSQYRKGTDEAFASLDMTGVTSRILYDRVFPVARLTEFTATDKSSPSHFLQARSELYEASYNASNQLSVSDLKSLIQDSERQRIVPIGITLAQFQVCNTAAIELVNTRYYAKTGFTTYTCFQTKQVTALASTLCNTIGKGVTTFQLPDWAIFSNRTAAVTSVVVNFGEGNPTQTLTVGGGTVQASYWSEGDRTIQYSINLSNGSTETAQSTLRVMGGARVAANFPYNDGISQVDSTHIEADVPFQGYDETQAWKGQGDVLTFSAQGRTQIRKPIIILDGFDPGDTRSAWGIYYDRLKYTGSSISNILGDELRLNNPDNGHDVLILNFPKYIYKYDGPYTYCPKYENNGGCINTVTRYIPRYRDGGADYIERNAMVLVKLIQSVNQQLQANGSTEKITIIGPSMGGLISRYALRYMEQNGMTHNCKLWVSFDSPHHGANIPIGTQLFLEYMANGMGEQSAKDGLDQLDTPAAKQMLIHHFRAYTNAPNGVDNEITAGAPGFRDRFYQSLNQMGYPEAGCLRKVALINGTKNGVAQSYSVPCGESMRIRAKLNTTTSAVCYALGIGSCFFTPFCFVPIAACAAGSDRVFEAYTYNSPANSDRCLVMRKQYTSFGIGLAERYVKGRGSNQTSLDALPGGYFNLIQTIVDGAKATVPTRLSKEYPFVIIHSAMSIFTSTDASANQQSPCFIPTVSSLALRNTNRNWGENLNYINSSNAKTETYFDDISVATGGNEDHTFLTNAGVTFVRQQLALANQQCGTAPSTCANTGSISYDRWNNIGGGNSVQDLKNNTNNLQSTPSVSQNLSVFQAPSNICDNCGTRIRGYVCPPTSGNYTFWVEGDDNTELWLSTTDQPANIQRIAYHNDWTGSLQWNKYSTQQSASINLQAGQRYYTKLNKVCNKSTIRFR
jgi:Putative serine esterase (DUF676)/PA14 domain